MKLDLYLTQKPTQNRLKTNIRVRTIKLLEENIGKKLLDTGLGNDFFGYDTRSTSNKSESKQVGLYQTRTLSA